MKTYNGGQAFPVHVYDGNWKEGMSLRDYFAIHALEYALQTYGSSTPERCKATAELTYIIADAMLTARTKDE